MGMVLGRDLFGTTRGGCIGDDESRSTCFGERGEGVFAEVAASRLETRGWQRRDGTTRI